MGDRCRSRCRCGKVADLHICFGSPRRRPRPHPGHFWLDYQHPRRRRIRRSRSNSHGIRGRRVAFNRGAHRVCRPLSAATTLGATKVGRLGRFQWTRGSRVRCVRNAHDREPLHEVRPRSTKAPWVTWEGSITYPPLRPGPARSGVRLGTNKARTPGARLTLRRRSAESLAPPGCSRRGRRCR